MDSKDLLLDALDECGAAYRKNLKRCRDEFSKTAVHDLRTSIRRLLAILKVTAFVTSTSKPEKLSDRLKDQLDGFSDLRDIQVMLHSFICLSLAKEELRNEERKHEFIYCPPCHRGPTRDARLRG